jgi:hypothetical protein
MQRRDETKLVKRASRVIDVELRELKELALLCAKCTDVAMLAGTLTIPIRPMTSLDTLCLLYWPREAKVHECVL